jgi:ABC-2 type transport system permease protein
MLFRSVYLKSLRDFRVGILGWGLGMGLLMYVVFTAIPSLVTTPAARASLVSLAASFSWLAEPVKVDTPGGYATWKYGPLILLVALWPILVSSRVLRGEEERGSLDVLLSHPRGRGRVALEKLAAIWTALLLMGLLIGLLAFAGGSGVKADLSLGNALLFGLNLALISAVFGGMSLLISQFTQERRTASGAAGGLLALFILLDMVHRVFPAAEWVSRLSPVYYFNLSRPLVPGYGSDPLALLILLVLALLLNGAALWLFVRRDVGATVPLPGFLRRSARAVPVEQALPANAWSLRSVYARGLAMIALPTFWWTLGIAGFGAFMVEIVKQTEVQLASLYASSPILRELLAKVGGGDITSNATLLSTLFFFLPLLLMAFAITQATRWSADEEDGRQELVLATPQSRLKVLLARFGALTTATVLIGVLTLAAMALTLAATGLKLDGGNLTAATLSMIPLGLLMAALGYLFAGWLRTAVDTGLLSFLLVAWFFITFIGPELKWPEATLRLSAFYYYGKPLVDGLPLGDMLIVLAVALVALVLASLRFMRKDIGR